jgi:HK97 gp10 family phage protein
MEYVKIEGLDGLVNRLRAFPVEMAKNGGPVRSALAKGGKLIREQAKANVRAIVAEPNENGMDSESTGVLEKSIIQKRHRNPKERGATEIYTVRVKSGKSPKGVSVTRYGKILEFGSKRIKAYAWLRRAAEAKRGEFFALVARELAAGITKIERKLGAGK